MGSIRLVNKDGNTYTMGQIQAKRFYIQVVMQ